MSARGWVAAKLGALADWLDGVAFRLDPSPTDAVWLDPSYPLVTKPGSEAFYAPPGPTHGTTPTKPSDGPTGAPDATHEATSGTAEGG